MHKTRIQLLLTFQRNVVLLVRCDFSLSNVNCQSVSLKKNLSNTEKRLKNHFVFHEYYNELRIKYVCRISQSASYIIFVAAFGQTK